MIRNYLGFMLALMIVMISGAWLKGLLPDVLPGLRLRMIQSGWKLKNAKHKPRAWAQYFMLIAGMGITTTVSATVFRGNGAVEELGVVSRRVVTDAGVAAIANSFLNTFENENFNFHDSGTGVAAEAAANTALGTPAGPARVAGTQSSPAGGQYRTVATIAYTGALAITEHGIFSASSAGTLLDRSVFAAINVTNGDSIQFTYTITFSSGG